MRIVLVGAVESTQEALETLIASGNAPVAVLTLPLETLTRHSDAVDLGPIVRENYIGIHYTNDVNSDETLHFLSGIEPDLLLVVGWSQICGVKFRNVCRLGAIGFHPSALPKLRGRAVIPWTILTGQMETGSTFFWLDASIDAGDIVMQRVFPVSPGETARSLYDRHIQELKAMIPDLVAAVQSGNPPRYPQEHSDATFCARRTAIDGRIDWHAPAAEIVTLVRAVGDPYPGAFTRYDGSALYLDTARVFPEGRRYIGLTGQVQTHTEQGFVVRCGDGECIEVTEWRMEDGKKPRRHAILGGGGGM